MKPKNVVANLTPEVYNDQVLLAIGRETGGLQPGIKVAKLSLASASTDGADSARW